MKLASCIPHHFRPDVWLAMVFMLVPFNFQLICAAQDANSLAINSVTVDGKPLSLPLSADLNLGYSPKEVRFSFGAGKANTQSPLRLRARLEGLETTWHSGESFMLLGIRFFNDSGDQIGQTQFQVSGSSAGWTGSLSTSVLTHRRESVIVPPKASRMGVIISSAGPPACIGIYVVANLIVTGISDNHAPVAIIQVPFDQKQGVDLNIIPSGWIRDGTHPSMAKILQIGQEPSIRAFTIEDDDTYAHAEWRFDSKSSQTIIPGERIVIEWNEMFSIGVGDLHTMLYPDLPPGKYRFHVVGDDIMGRPTREESSIEILVPRPFWRLLWFKYATVFLAILTVFGGWRYAIWNKMQREMSRLKSEQALERERLRIAQDIHDDLGARVTQISLVSARFQNDSTLPAKAHAGFSDIKQMSQEMVTALYETVWAVNPEYDNIEALGDYLCQMANDLSTRAQVGVRLQVDHLPSNILISSQIRHNIVMVVKEALNNVVKHARASEVSVNMSFKALLLDIKIQDNGCGLQAVNSHSGNGIANMRRRMKAIGGNCSFESEPGHGTKIHLQLFTRNLTHT